MNEEDNYLGVEIKPDHEVYAEDEQIAFARGENFAEAISLMAGSILHGMNGNEVGAFWDAFGAHFNG